MGPKVHIKSPNRYLPYNNFSLPSGAEVAEELADYVIDFEWTEAQIGQYTSGQKAMGRHCKVIITDRSTGKRVASRRFLSEPPSVRIPAGRHGPEYSTPSFKEINDYIGQWYRDPDEPPKSEAAREFARVLPIIRLCGVVLGAMFLYLGLYDLLVDDPIRDALTGGGSNTQGSLFLTIVSGAFIAFSLFAGRRKRKKRK